MLAELAPGTQDFLPSRMFMSLHNEMFQAHAHRNGVIDYSTVRRDDPRINDSSWAERFPNVPQWYGAERALTPSKRSV
jgi:hypothetical protein